MIAKARWKYFGHTLRMEEEMPPHKAMLYYFMPESYLVKKFGAKRTTIVTTLQNDIRETRDKFPAFQIESMNNLHQFKTVRKLAQDRSAWRKVVKAVVDTAQAKYSC